MQSPIDAASPSSSPSPPPTWRLHSSVLRNQNLQDGLLKWAQQYSASLQAIEDRVLRWAQFHEQLRQMAFSLALPIQNRKEQAARDYASLKATYDSLSLSTPADVERFNAISGPVYDAERAVADKKASDTVGGRGDIYRPSPWNMSEAPSAEVVSITALLDDEAREVQDAQGMINIVERRYGKMLDSPATSSASADFTRILGLDQLLNVKHRNLNASQTAESDANLTSDEILAALDAERTKDARDSNEEEEDSDLDGDDDDDDEALERRLKKSIPMLHDDDASPIEEAAGPDGLPAALYWLLRDVCVPLLVDLANALMDGGSLSEKDATYRTMLKHKGGDPRDLSNYQPVPVPDVALRVIERALSNRLTSNSLSNFWPSSHQAYVQGGHTEDSVGTLQMVLTRIRSGKEAPAVMITHDRETALDQIDHNWLLQALAHYGFGPRLRALVKGMLLDNAHLVVSVNDSITKPIKVKRGLLQTGSACSPLFLVAMLPLLDSLDSEGLGVTLGAQPGPQLKVPYLVSADKIITFARDTEPLAALYSLFEYFAATAGGVSIDKLKAIVLSPPGAVSSAMAHFQPGWLHPILPPQELVWLGHGIDLLEGGVAKGALADSLADTRRLWLRLKKGADNLSKRVCLVRTEILPPLAHRMSLSPHPRDFVRDVLKSLGPWKWDDGSRDSIPVEILTTPGVLGGWGLPNPDSMLIATTGAAIVRWLRRQDQAGIYFRRCLHEYLRDEQGLSEASLLLHEGETFETRINDRRLASKSFWANVVWTLAQLGVTLDEDWSKYKLQHLMVLPYAYPAFGTDPRFRKVNNFVNASQRDRFDLWGDIAWGKEADDGQQTLTLAPPSRSAMLRFKARLRCREARDKPVGDMAHFIDIDSARWFPTLPREVQQLLREAPQQYGLLPDVPGGEGVRPLKWNLDAIEYPWHLHRIAGLKLDDFTAERAYAKVAPSEVHFPGPLS